MINYEQWCRLKQLAERDRLSAAQIARALGLAARTVRKWLKEPYRPRKRVERASTLDPVSSGLSWTPYSRAAMTGETAEVAGDGGLSEYGGDDSLRRVSRLPSAFRSGFADLVFGADPTRFSQGALRSPLGAGVMRIVNGAGRRGMTLQERLFLRGLELFIEHALQQGNRFGSHDRSAERLCLGQNVPHIPSGLIHRGT
jgi:hypothetical protein